MYVCRKSRTNHLQAKLLLSILTIFLLLFYRLVLFYLSFSFSYVFIFQKHFQKPFPWKNLNADEKFQDVLLSAFIGFSSGWILLLLHEVINRENNSNNYISYFFSVLKNPEKF